MLTDDEVLQKYASMPDMKPNDYGGLRDAYIAALCCVLILAVMAGASVLYTNTVTTRNMEILYIRNMDSCDSLNSMLSTTSYYTDLHKWKNIVNRMVDLECMSVKEAANLITVNYCKRNSSSLICLEYAMTVPKPEYVGRSNAFR